MTETPNANGSVPPKIKLNGAPAAPGAVPPKAVSTVKVVKLRAPSEKSETSRIDLATAEPLSAEAAKSAGLNVREVFAKKTPPDSAATSHIDLKTSLIDTEGAATQTPPPAPASSPKASTSRIDLNTARIDLEAPTSAGKKAAMDASLNTTVRISMEDILDSDTPKPPDLDGTRHLTLDALTAATPTGVAAETPKAPPIRTVKLQRPTMTSKTLAMPRPSTAPAAPAVAIPVAPSGAETRVDSRVQGGADTVAETPSPASMKGATAKIEIPPEAAEAISTPTQRKTIRIKRPDSMGGTPRTVTLTTAARQQVGGRQAVGGAAGAASVVAPAEATAEEGETVGTAFSVVALVATLVLIALVYLIAAQIADLPLPGRIVGG